MNELTGKQVRALVKTFSDAHFNSGDWKQGIINTGMLENLIITAIHAQLAEVEQERDSWKRECSLMAAHQRIDNYQRLLDKLADRDARIARLEKALETGFKKCTHLAREARKRMEIESAREHEYGAFVLRDIQQRALITGKS